MDYDSDLRFFQRLLHNFHIHTWYLDSSDPAVPALDLGLRQMLQPDFTYDTALKSVLLETVLNTIYRIHDEYLCTYFFFRLPDTDIRKGIVVGPFTLTEITKQDILNCMEFNGLIPEYFPQLEKYYTALPFIADSNQLLVLLNTLGETLWGDLANFSMIFLESSLFGSVKPQTEPQENIDQKDSFFNMQLLEDRYSIENQLLLAVSQGVTHKAEMLLLSFQNGVEARVTDPVRNLKNYMIILNTLLRKAAEKGSVHPLHIDALSARFARKIELLTSVKAAKPLQQEMVHKYCLLVKNHSMKGFSLLIRKVLTQIDSDLTADLSLKTLAELLNVNASYLSTLFKKETGSTLTDYVNRKRVEHAIFLLNSTGLQVQTIAQYCGIQDVNYFTKTFKKYVGKTPKEYRESVSFYSV